MTSMIFFEKPGCINGEKQKKILIQAGNTLQCINILEHKWTEDKLLPFIQGKEPSTMMNYTAPAIKNGRIHPDRLSFQEAVSLMIADPILIKRPLIQIDQQYIQGFDDERLAAHLGTWDNREDVTTCPNLHTLSCDDLNAAKRS